MIEIYTDGSYHEKHNLGAYAAIIIENNKEKEISGLEKEPISADEMELLAIVKALELIKESKLKINLYSDSEYIISKINNKIDNWAKNNWPENIKHIKIWKDFYEIYKNLTIKCTHMSRNSKYIKKCHQMANNLINIEILIKELNQKINRYNQKYREKESHFKYNLSQIKNIIKYIPETNNIKIKKTDTPFLSWNGEDFYIHEKNNNNENNIYKLSLEIQNENKFPAKLFKDTDKMINDFLIEISNYIDQNINYI